MLCYNEVAFAMGFSLGDSSLLGSSPATAELAHLKSGPGIPAPYLLIPWAISWLICACDGTIHRVVAEYSWNDKYQDNVFALGVPNIVVVSSVYRNITGKEG